MWRSRRTRSYEIAPEDIFLDSSNLPEHEASQFEGRIASPVSRRSLIAVGVVFSLVAFAYTARALQLQVVQGSHFAEVSRDNSLQSTPLFAPRGLILDRTGVALAWNDIQAATSTSASSSPYALRRYIQKPGFSLLLGFIRYPQHDKQGLWWNENYTPVAGVELAFNDLLAGLNGSTMTETDAHLRVQRQDLINEPVDGKNVSLSVDADVQARLYQALEAQARQQGFRAGAGIIMDVRTGEILAITSFPEYSSQAFTDGDSAAIQAAAANPLTPMLDRAISGLYSPGSIVKPIFAAGALDSGIISPDKEIDSVGAITVPNPYDPAHPSVFHDWTVHGWIDMRTAIAVSSDEYFYTIGGGFGGQRGLGISGLDKYAYLFGLASTTGIILPGEQDGVVPSPAWKAINFPNDPTWRLGDTYHTAIGGYGFLITPIEAVRFAAAIANGGKLLTPQLLASSTPEYTTVPVSDANLQIIREGMRLAVTSTRRDATVRELNIPGIDIAAKTGTAQIGTHNQFVNSLSIGFWPAENPHWAFAVVLEQGPSTETAGVAVGMAPFFEWLVQNKPQYVN